MRLRGLRLAADMKGFSEIERTYVRCYRIEYPQGSSAASAEARTQNISGPQGAQRIP
jgi:hypothetical protein